MTSVWRNVFNEWLKLLSDRSDACKCSGREFQTDGPAKKTLVFRTLIGTTGWTKKSTTCWRWGIIYFQAACLEINGNVRRESGLHCKHRRPSLVYKSTTDLMILTNVGGGWRWQTSNILSCWQRVRWRRYQRAEQVYSEQHFVNVLTRNVNYHKVFHTDTSTATLINTVRVFATVWLLY